MTGGGYRVSGSEGEKMNNDRIADALSVIESSDRELAAVFERRLEAVKTVAEYRREHGIPVPSEPDGGERAQELSMLIGDAEKRPYYMSFLQGTLAASEKYHRRIMQGVRVAYTGVKGAFANIAARRIFPEGEMVSYSDFASSYEAVERGECDCAVLPIENSYAGEVGQVIELMFSGSLYIGGVYSLRVKHNLLGLPGATPATVKKVVSHPQALHQCAPYIQERGYECIQESNTAVAAQRVADGGDPTVAAIASAETAKLYGLEVLDHDINESGDNTTRFAVFSRTPNTDEDHRDRSRFLLMFILQNEPGALASAINVISTYGFNMKVIRSRPVKEPAWEYYFYVEAEGDEESENGRKMIAELRQHCRVLKVVGHYSDDIRLGASGII